MLKICGALPFLSLEIAVLRTSAGVGRSQLIDSSGCAFAASSSIRSAGGVQGAYNSVKPGNLREFVNSVKLREFKIYSGNL